MSKRAPIGDPILAGANEKGVSSFTTAEFESILEKGSVEWSTVRAPQPEAHSDLRRKPRQVSQVNRSPHRNRSPRN